MTRWQIYYPSPEEKKNDKKLAGWSLLIGSIILVILLFIGFPTDLWTPKNTFFEYIRVFLTLCLMPCGAFIMELLANGGPVPGLFIIAFIIYIIRYIYLIIRFIIIWAGWTNIVIFLVCVSFIILVVFLIMKKNRK